MDARSLLEVNQDPLDPVFEQASSDQIVVVAATWGRGCDPSLLGRLEPYRRASGYNGTVLALVPRSEWPTCSPRPVPPARPGEILVLSLAYGKAHEEWRRLR